MPRAFLILLLGAFLAFGANVRLYLTDGTFHIVREYQVNGDRVRFYSVERSEWEEVPLSLVDLKRTEGEQKERDETLRKQTAEMAAEEKFEREQADERARVPQETGVFLVDGKELRVLKPAESKVVSKKSRSILKVLAPIPIVSGKSTVELDGEHSANITSADRPEFYIRLTNEERFSIVKMAPKKGVRVVQSWEIVPVTKEMIETQQDVEIFRKQVESGLYKIWPMQPLEPGEYAVVEYTAGKGNIQTWDFACRPAK